MSYGNVCRSVCLEPVRSRRDVSPGGKRALHLSVCLEPVRAWRDVSPGGKRALHLSVCLEPVCSQRDVSPGGKRALHLSVCLEPVRAWRDVSPGGKRALHPPVCLEPVCSRRDVSPGGKRALHLPVSGRIHRLQLRYLPSRSVRITTITRLCFLRSVHNKRKRKDQSTIKKIKEQTTNIKDIFAFSFAFTRCEWALRVRLHWKRVNVRATSLLLTFSVPFTLNRNKGHTNVSLSLGVHASLH